VITEHHLPVSRTARYYTLGRPGDAIREVWFGVHGYGQLAERFIRHFEALDDGRHLVIAPEALSRFYLDTVRTSHVQSPVGASWMTREDRLSEIDDYILYLDALYAQVMSAVERQRVRVVVLGFSQGVATVCRWLERGTARADRLVLWGGHLPNETDFSRPENPLRSVRLTLVAGDGDEFATPEAVAAEERALRANDVAFERLTFAGGHRLDHALLAEMAGVSAPAPGT